MMKRVALVLPALMVSLWSGQAAMAADEMDMHAHHHHMMQMDTKRTEADIELPKVQLIRSDGKKVQFQDELADGRIVVLSFIYTTCTAICPMTSQTIYKLQGKLGGALDKVHLVSVSIDPEQDTPKRLAEYAEKYRASKYWDHYTGTVEASVAVQKAFGVYRGDKMNHAPVTLIWNGKGKSWVRIDGFASPDDLLHEVHGQMGH